MNLALKERTNEELDKPRARFQAYPVRGPGAFECLPSGRVDRAVAALIS